MHVESSVSQNLSAYSDICCQIHMSSFRKQPALIPIKLPVQLLLKLFFDCPIGIST